MYKISLQLVQHASLFLTTFRYQLVEQYMSTYTMISTSVGN